MGRQAFLCALAAMALLAADYTADAFMVPAAVSLRAPSRQLVSNCPPRAAETRPKNLIGGWERTAVRSTACCVWCLSDVVGHLAICLWVFHAASRHAVRQHERDPGSVLV